jgi:hypothetical protein
MMAINEEKTRRWNACLYLDEPNREVGISNAQVGQLTLIVAVAAWPAWSKRGLEGSQYKLVQANVTIGPSSYA